MYNKWVVLVLVSFLFFSMKLMQKKITGNSITSIFTMTRTGLKKLSLTATAIEVVCYLHNQSQSHVLLLQVQPLGQLLPQGCHILQMSHLPACNNQIFMLKQKFIISFHFSNLLLSCDILSLLVFFSQSIIIFKHVNDFYTKTVIREFEKNWN